MGTYSRQLYFIWLLVVTCDVIEEGHVTPLTSSAPWCINFELFAPFILGELTCTT